MKDDLLNGLEQYLGAPFEKFKGDKILIAAAERKFQLLVDLASDINTQIVLEKGGVTPDTYKQSFSAIARLGIINHNLSKLLVESAEIRNILVHEYDFEEDYEKFYKSAKKILPAYREYIKAICGYVKTQK